LTQLKKLYFASDFHLGMPNENDSRIREKKIIEWLEYCRKDAKSIFLLGDVFDFWFEYHKTIPKGFVRFLGTIASITDQGIPVYLFPGNHDLWISDYLKKECGVTLVEGFFEFEHQGKRFFLHHGDGLGPGDTSYKIMKRIFTARFARFLFQWIHPNLGIALAHALSRKSRLSQSPKEDNYLGHNKEHLTQFVLSHSQSKTNESRPHYYLFGHRHLVIDTTINGVRYLNLGEWLHGSQFVVFDGETLQFLSWPNNEPVVPANTTE
jgi:UDP-2,3-diacylglucosamine hydrolase